MGRYASSLRHLGILGGLLLPLLLCCKGEDGPEPTICPVDHGPVASIEFLNKDKEALNSHRGETDRSALECDWRTMHILTEADLGVQCLDYPRIKMHPDEGYILFYQTERTGHSSYCAFSKDLEHWDALHPVWEKHASTDPDGNPDNVYYADADMVVAANGDMLVFGTRRLKGGGHKYLQQWGIVMKRSKDGGKIWGDEKLLYKTCVWEPYPIRLPSGEIQVFFTDSDHDWDPTITGISLLRSTDNGYTWKVQAPVIKYASGEAVAHQRSVDMPAPATETAVRYSAQMPAVTLLNGTDVALAVFEQVNPEQKLRLSMAWESRAWPKTLDGDESGPAKTTQYFIGGSAPYLAQFPSGETVLSYTGSNWYIRLGDEKGESLATAPFFSPRMGTSHWGNIELENDHSLLATTAMFHGAEGDPEYESVRDIAVCKLRLNHRIDAKRMTPTLDGVHDEWAGNTDALFLGSDSQAQCSFRFAHSADSLYLLIDCLDSLVADGDRLDLQFADGTNASSIVSFALPAPAVAAGLNRAEGLSPLRSFLSGPARGGSVAKGCSPSAATVPHAGIGYVAELSWPLASLPVSDGSICFNAVLRKGSVADGFNFRTATDPTNWFRIRLR